MAPGHQEGPPMKSFLSRSVALLLIFAALYLAIVNVALSLPATRTWLNAMQPDQFSVTWRRAWSPYPLRLVLTGLAADGQTPTEQWQVDARRAGLSVSLLPLLRGEIHVHDLDLTDIDLRLRPRPQRDDDEHDRRIADYYPVIRNRDPSALAEPVPEESGVALVLEIDDIDVHGTHSFWVSHLRGTVPGRVAGSFRMDTGAGELSLAGGALDLAVTSLVVGPEQPVIDAAAVRGRVEIPPFRLSETEGLQLMRVAELVDADVDLPVQSLDFLAWLVPPLEALDLHGQGRLRGRLALARGEVLGGTDLTVEAHALSMGLGPYDFSGDGQVELVVDAKDESQADLTVRFDQVQAALDPPAGDATARPVVLFTGEGLAARLHAAEVDPTTTSTAKQIAELQSEVTLSFRLDIPSMRVDDLSVYNRLFPETWSLALLGGSGTVSGLLEVAEERLSLRLDLASEHADLKVADYHANSDLLIQLRTLVEDRGNRRDSATLDLAGTLVRIQNAELDQVGADSAEAPRWSAELRVGQADLTLPLSSEQRAQGPVLGVARTLSDQGFGTLLARADGGASVALTLSRLDWIAALLGRPMGLGLEGSGELDAEIRLDDGLPAVGSALRIPREPLTLRLLDHQIDGSGEAALTLEQAGKQTRAHLAIALRDARAHRQDEDEPSVGDVRLDAEIRAEDPFTRGKSSADGAELALKIHSARVPDVRSYNPYLPKNAPVELLGGAASVAGELTLAPESAAGQLLFTADDMHVAVADEDLRGNLRLELLIQDGAAEELRFDITGSSLLLEGFRVAGATASSADTDWHARLQLQDTEILWHKPVHLAMKADVTVKDTRPFVAVLDNVRGKHDWVDNLATVEDLGGHIILAVDGDSAVLEDAMLSGPEIGVHAKGASSGAGREAMLLLRWHNLIGAVELQGEHRHFDIADARGRFDAYAPGKLSLASLRGAAAGSAVAEDPGQFATGEGRARDPVQNRESGSVPKSRPERPDRDQRSDSPFMDHSL